MSKFKYFIFIVILFFSFKLSFAEENIGIIKGIWFSDNKFISGDTIRVYTAIQNNSGEDAFGVIEFFDNELSLGTRDFSVLQNRVSDYWVDVLLKTGRHNFSVKIITATKDVKKENPVLVTPYSIYSEEIIVVIEDTDKDGLDDSIDEDDDNDGFLDIDEIKNDTDSKDKYSVPNTKNIIDEKNLNKGSDNFNLKENTPSVIKSLSEDNNIVRYVGFGVSSLQENILNFFEREEKKIERKEEVIKQYDQDNIDTLVFFEEVENKKKFSNYFFVFIKNIYLWLLKLFNLIFSSWWVFLILLIIFLYYLIFFVLKMLFKNKE
jgi:hypothetical protein